jgi:lipid A oxidase
MLKPAAATGVAAALWGPTRRWRAFDRLAGLAGAAALVLSATVPRPPLPVVAAQSQQGTNSTDAMTGAARAALIEQVRYKGGETFFAAYTGAPYTYASDLHIEGAGTDMTVHGVDWEGKPFDDPIYYGARIIRWRPRSAWGAMLDFTHSKAYAPLEQEVELTGTKGGQPLPPRAKLEDLFHHLQFTHGHNMLTLNAMLRLPSLGAMISPYVGAGFGVALPHAEVQLKGTGRRTYEYQYVGPAAQLLIGVELRVPRLSYFIEYKATTASYRAPLQERDGSWLPVDLWRQFQRWMQGRPPPGGWASTWLTSHQLIGGMGVRTLPAAPAP